MPTAPVTSKLTLAEQWSMYEHLNAVECCANKCDFYLNHVQDPQVKEHVMQCRDMCTSHATQLRSTLQNAGISV
ncbi:MAG: hypothetical protein ACOYBM_05895 [Dethiobacteria bacterium]|jgi:hypothetical protein|nr:hypothetical protein [Bacillota bacterium]